MQLDEPLEEFVLADPLPWYERLLSGEDLIVIAIIVTAVAFGLLARRHRRGNPWPWTNWLMVATSIPAVLLLLWPLPESTSINMLAFIVTSSLDLELLHFALPLLAPVLLLIWKLRLLIWEEHVVRVAPIAAALLAATIVSDTFVVVEMEGDWLFPEPTPHVFGVAAAASAGVIVLTLFKKISAATSVSTSLMLIFLMHSAILLSAALPAFEENIHVFFKLWLLILFAIAAELGYTLVRDWGGDRYWVWERDPRLQRES